MDHIISPFTDEAIKAGRGSVSFQKSYRLSDRADLNRSFSICILRGCLSSLDPAEADLEPAQSNSGEMLVALYQWQVARERPYQRKGTA